MVYCNRAICGALLLLLFGTSALAQTGNSPDRKPVYPDISWMQYASAILDTGVHGLAVHEVLHKLLDARTGREKSQPRLVPVSEE